MGEIIMNEKLKEKLAEAAFSCAGAAAGSAYNEENPIDFAKSAELLTRAMLNLAQTECYIPHFNETEPDREENDSEFKVASIGNDGNKLGVVLRGRSEYLTDEYKKWTEGCEYPDHSGFELVEKLGENKGATSDLTLTFFKVH